ncbi:MULTISPECIES: hypothetical protein [unclassified Microcoleus]|nr:MULTISPECIES: hypothetical protein [unclassified Microcoleus]
MLANMIFDLLHQSAIARNRKSTQINADKIKIRGRINIEETGFFP